MAIGNDERQRYARHLLLPEVGLAGQERLRTSRVLCLGAGGLGSPLAMYLAAAGVGYLILVDHDRVDLSNLQRQILHGTPDVGRPKTASATDALRRLNPHVEVEVHAARFTRDNALSLVTACDLVVDGTDNFATRYLANDACVLARKPNIYGSIFRFEGQASLFAPHLGFPCYRCLYPEPPPPGAAPSCAEAGVLGVLPGLVGTIQATEALKLLLGIGTSLGGRLLVVKALEMRFQELKVRRDPECPICGEHPTQTGLVDYDRFCAGKSGGDAPDEPVPEVSVQDLRRVLTDPSTSVRVLDVREASEAAVVRLPGAALLPLSELARRWTELDSRLTYYIHCQGGRRSQQAVEFLQARGFASVHNVRGGLRAWAEEIDPSLPRL